MSQPPPWVEPSAQALAALERRVRRAIPYARAAASPWCPLEIVGQEHIPTEGPALLLSNHVGLLDAGVMVVAAGRSVQIVASEAQLHSPVFGPLFRFSGAIPRKKFVSDSRSVRMMRAWRDLGAVVGLFPEGERSWDGRLMPLVPGLDKLIKLIDAPVIVMRLINGWRQSPRWAEYMRRAPVRVEVDPPRRYDRRSPGAAMLEELRRALFVDPERGREQPVWGHHLAAGLSNLLFLCPRCGAHNEVVEQGDSIFCCACRGAWRLDPHHVLHPRGGGPELRLEEEFARLRLRCAEEPWADPAALARDGTVLHSAPVQLWEVHEPELRPFRSGRLRLTRDALLLEDQGRLRWSCALAQLAACTLDVRRQLQLRQQDGRTFELQMTQGSALQWNWLVEHWRIRSSTG